MQVMGLQHSMAMLAGLTTVPYLIGVNAFNVSTAPAASVPAAHPACCAGVSWPLPPTAAA